MKAKDLAQLLNGVHPDADVYIDLGLCYNQTKNLIYEMLTDPDRNYSDVGAVEITFIVEDGVREVYLCPYDGLYDLADDKVVEPFFEEHGLNEVMEKAFDEAKKQ